MTSTSSKTSFFLVSIFFYINLSISFSFETCSSTSVSSCKQSPKFISSVQSTIQASRQAISAITSQLYHIQNDFDLSNAINDCVELIDDSIDLLGSSIDSPTGVLQCGRGLSPCTSVSAALANQETCMEGLDLLTSNTSLKNRVIQAVNRLEPMMSQLLDIVKSASTIPSFNPVRTAPFSEMYINILHEKEANVTVALDGSGNYRSIMDAVNAAPKDSKHRFVIHIKKGVYKEYVKITKHKPNLVMIGEGQNETIITGNRSHKSGYKTFHSATFAVGGCNFMAFNLTIQNTAGPDAGQAVAMRSNADNLVFYNCTFSGYQDTLYAKSGKQFFRECVIKGTVDFIFGDATAVFQLCKILVRNRKTGNINTITAQSRAVACSESGYSFHACEFKAEEKLKAKTRTFLGRPWKNHSRTVMMKSYMEDSIDREGWLDWDGRSALDTIYYGEYMNNGPGANVWHRVKWPGFHIIEKESEAMKFTVGQFIDGDEWLPFTGVDYISGLVDS